MKIIKLRPFLIIFIIALAAKIFLFNYKSIMSLMNREVEVDDFSLGKGLSSEGGKSFKITGRESYIEITQLDEHISNICLDVEITGGYGYDADSAFNGVFDVMPVEIYANDDAHAQYFKLGERKLVHNVSQSRYMVTHLSGKTQRIKIQFNKDTDTVFSIRKLSYNARVPMHISVIRVLAVLALMSAIYILRPSSRAYSVVYNTRSTKQKAVKLMLFAAVGVVFFVLANANPYFVYPRWEHHYQYQMLAEAFSDGQVSLKDEPSAAIKTMENPYDTGLRASLGIEYKWDRAYYNGKYYVYYGVLPELIFYFPFYRLTGMDFSTNAGIYITGIFFLAGIFFLMESIVIRWFKKTPFILYLLAVLMASVGSGALAVMMRPDFYSLPIIMAVALSVWGLGFWIRSKDARDKNRLSPGMLAAGSLCMALVAACRPQLLVVSFVAVLLFFDDVFKKKILILGRKFANTAAFVLPYIIVAAGVMYYNYIRFGSPFDFGANYNLTTNDMTHRGFVAGRTFLGLFYFLFQMPQTSAVFPFTGSVTVSTGYLGTTVTEYMYGGIMACNIWLLPVLLVLINKKELWNNKKVISVLRALCASAVIIVIADTQMAGILARYIMDFGWILFVAAAAVCFALWDYFRKYGNSAYKKIFAYFLIIAFIQGICYNFLRIFATDTECIIESNPEFYYRIMHTIAFWM